MRILYHTPESVCSQKARIGFAEIGLEFRSHIVDFAAGEQFTEAFRKLNPDAVVPVLDDDGIVVRESSLILEYADERYNDGNLMPKGVGDRAVAKLWLIRALGIHNAINSVTFATTIREMDRKRTKEEREARWARLPDPAIAKKRRDLFEHGLDSVHVRSALRLLQILAQDIDRRAKDDGWLAGTKYSLADTAMTAYVDRLERIGLHILWQELPHLSDWLERVRARPSYATAIAAWIAPLPSAAEKARKEIVWRSVT